MALENKSYKLRCPEKTRLSTTLPSRSKMPERGPAAETESGLSV